MDTELIIFNEYCQKSHTDPTFIISLEEGGLIEIRTVDGERYLLASQLRELERYSHETGQTILRFQRQRTEPASYLVGRFASKLSIPYFRTSKLRR